MIKSFFGPSPANKLTSHIVRASLLLMPWLCCIVIIFSTFKSYGTDIYRTPWQWDIAIPKKVIPPGPPPTCRSQAVFDKLHISRHTSVKNIVAVVGVPDGFAKQLLVTRYEGVPVNQLKAGPEAGTYHYLLDDGGEVFILVSNNDRINAVWLFEPSGRRHELYSWDAE
jgi:hypothetical protein